MSRWILTMAMESLLTNWITKMLISQNPFSMDPLTMDSINSLVSPEIQKIHWTPSQEFTSVITNGHSQTVQKCIGQG